MSRSNGGRPGIVREKRAETGQRVQAEEDERADAGGQQAGQQDQADQRAAQARGLQQQEGAEQRRAQQRADRGEAAGRRDHARRHRRSVARSETHGQDTETASDHDQRSLGAENDPEAQRAERGEQNARQFDRRDRAGGLEAVSRRVTTGARQPADRRCDQQPRQHEQRNRPPIGYGIEAEVVGDALEERLLSDRNELEERERDGGDRHADDGREHEQLDVGGAPQQRLGVRRGRRGRRVHAASNLDQRSRHRWWRSRRATGLRRFLHGVACRLVTIATGEPVVPARRSLPADRPTGLVGGARRFARRHRTLITIGGSLLTAAILVVAARRPEGRLRAGAGPRAALGAGGRPRCSRSWRWSPAARRGT